MYNLNIHGPFFEWDERKNLTNQRKHGVSFQEARTVFLDEYAKDFFDLTHSDKEERIILLGISERLRVLVVCYCLGQKGTMIRIFSARRAAIKEEQEYWRDRP